MQTEHAPCDHGEADPATCEWCSLPSDFAPCGACGCDVPLREPVDGNDRPTYTCERCAREHAYGSLTPWAREVRSALEYAPRNVQSKAAGLRGWTRDLPSESRVVCALCSARLTARGFGTLLVGMVSVWDDQPAPLGPCDGCGVRP